MSLLCAMGIHRFKPFIAEWRLEFVTMALEVRRCDCGLIHKDDAYQLDGIQPYQPCEPTLRSAP